jgi:hypothetical protein
MGRPSDYTQEIADRICEKIADGLSLRSICLDEEMPNKATVFRWLAAKKEFSDQYARAREAQADTLADEMLDIADDGDNDWMERKVGGASVGWQENGEAIGRSRLRLDTRKWIASKLKPKKYGEKVDMQHTGPDGGPVNLHVTFASGGSPVS